jgi:hypothetical protein
MVIHLGVKPEIDILFLKHSILTLLEFFVR